MVQVRYSGAKALVKLGVLSLLVGGSLAQPYRVVVVNGQSMSPTYSDDSTHIVKRTNGNLYRGEVVVVDTAFGTLIKRVAFLPGDRITQVKLGGSWVDAVNLNVMPRKSKHVEMRSYVVRPGEVYLLGDNRTRSVDSATFGTVPITEVWGKLVDQKPFIEERFANGQWTHLES
jgi:signal peptidase I